MAFLETYRQQVALLIRTIPFVAKEEAFALKGGTAINLFVRDMPRLSVDIDLTYLPVEDRTASLAAIDAAMLRIAERIEAGIPGAKVNPSRSADEKIVTKLIVRAGGVQIKIEITPVLRGTVYDPVVTTVVPTVEDEFGFAEMQVVSFADLYAGKIVAALDRQHPRDLFDVRDLLAHEGISDELRRAFLVYLISHNRPMAEVLAPTRKPMAEEFARGFVGMTQEPVALADLEAAREAIIAAMVTDMPEAHRRFLIGFKRGEPDWELLGIPEARQLPAVMWKQRNLDRLPAGKRRELTDLLEKLLFR
ncbi:nucleotidyl transferase AbiEii/AbiGii toxin family protein [Altererythrobacter sp. H2]|uniref:nucleotidyl transferase AbiEii/AbiGii toxin family protein n=1 Tax=Altererythrobacter sp. H2 TaxID=3108391 RepID=UPI002B4BB441|nr:nucleotidyl transferase AbiEii/AbiGii toxin family protein [Altererythrobacter sp. H2]WRK96527.1 nucleotidyl transferase AbiEii/AbiGii toxin family protein [Altererythrobacter sp. H2]